MNNNDVARSLRFALNITDLKVVELFESAGYKIEKKELESLFAREGEPGYAECGDELMERFLEGLIISRRGKKEGTAAPVAGAPVAAAPVAGVPVAAKPIAGAPVAGVPVAAKPVAAKPAEHSPARKPRLTNNDILRGIRIALQLKDDDIIGIMALAGIELSRSELSALFRRRGQPNYRPCGDQFLRNFLAGLTTKYRI
jgi:uncharacterized protein YehS (DUF1456 family)